MDWSKQSERKNEKYKKNDARKPERKHKTKYQSKTHPHPSACSLLAHRNSEFDHPGLTIHLIGSRSPIW